MIRKIQGRRCETQRSSRIGEPSSSIDEDMRRMVEEDRARNYPDIAEEINVSPNSVWSHFRGTGKSSANGYS